MISRIEVFQPVYIRELDECWYSPDVFYSREEAQAFIETKKKTSDMNGQGLNYWSIDKLTLTKVFEV